MKSLQNPRLQISVFKISARTQFSLKMTKINLDNEMSNQFRKIMNSTADNFHEITWREQLHFLSSQSSVSGSFDPQEGEGKLHKDNNILKWTKILILSMFLG